MGNRVLIIEDNAQNAKLARDVLQFHGFETEVAPTGADGVVAASCDPPDVILLDERLPDGSGFAVLDQLRADERTSDIPVVAVTASAMAGDRERMLAAGFDGYMSKPIDSRALPDLVRSFCPGGAG